MQPVLKIDGSRYARNKRENPYLISMNIRKKVNDIMSKINPLSLTNPIKYLEILFTNERTLILKKDDYLSPTLQNNIRYVKDDHCFVIDKKGILENFAGKIEASIVPMNDRHGNHNERKLRKILMAKCGMQRAHHPVMGVIFYLETGEYWYLDEVEFDEIGSEYYVIFGVLNVYMAKSNQINRELDEKYQTQTKIDVKEMLRLKYLEREQNITNNNRVVKNTAGERKEKMKIRNIGGKRNI